MNLSSYLARITPTMKNAMPTRIPGMPPNRFSFMDHVKLLKAMMNP